MIALAARFVPAADEVWRLQRDDDPECRWFREAVRGTEDPSPGTMQGTYVLTASGELLGRINSTSAAHVARMLEAALARWEQLPDATRAAAAPRGAAPRHRWEDSYPADGLVLERFARDVGAAPTAAPTRPVNRDAAWFASGELAGFLPEPLEVGSARAVSAPLVERLVRFSLVDNVRGQTLPFAAAAVEAAELTAEVTAREGDLVTLQLRGASRASSDGTEAGEDYWRSNKPWPRSVTALLRGRATWDARRRRFASFELVALAERTGRTTFNGRSREEEGDAPRIGFLFRLAPTELRVAPTFVNLYGARWIKMPR